MNSISFFLHTCLEWGELLISRRALAPRSKDSGSNPDPFRSSGSAALVDSDGSAGDSDVGGGGGEEEKKGKRNRESAWARLCDVDIDVKAAAAIAAAEHNLEAAAIGIATDNKLVGVAKGHRLRFWFSS